MAQACGGLATYDDAETNETLPDPGVNRKLRWSSSSLDADDDFSRVTQAVRSIDGDEAGFASEAIVPGLEAVLGIWVQRKGDRPVVEDVRDLVECRDCKCAAVEEVAVGA